MRRARHSRVFERRCCSLLRGRGFTAADNAAARSRSFQRSPRERYFSSSTRRGGHARLGRGPGGRGTWGGGRIVGAEAVGLDEVEQPRSTFPFSYSDAE